VRVKRAAHSCQDGRHLWARHTTRPQGCLPSAGRDCRRRQQGAADEPSRVYDRWALDRGPHSPLASDAYLRGTMAASCARATPAAATQAFEEALAIDSAYAPPTRASPALEPLVNFQYSGGAGPVSTLAGRSVPTERSHWTPTLARVHRSGFGLSTGLRFFVRCGAYRISRGRALRPNSGEAHAFTANALSEPAVMKMLSRRSRRHGPRPVGARIRVVQLNGAWGRRYDVACERLDGPGDGTSPPARHEHSPCCCLVALSTASRSTCATNSTSKPWCLRRSGAPEAAAIVESLAAASGTAAPLAVPEGLGCTYAWLGDVERRCIGTKQLPASCGPAWSRCGVFDRVRQRPALFGRFRTVDERNRARLARRSCRPGARP